MSVNVPTNPFLLFWYNTRNTWFIRSTTFNGRIPSELEESVFLQFLPCDAMLARNMLSSCVCLSSVTSRVLWRLLNLRSHKQSHTIAQRLQFADAKDVGEIPVGPSPSKVANRGVVGYNPRYLTNILLYLRNGVR